TSPWKWRHLKSVIVPSVQSPPSMLKLHDFCNRAGLRSSFVQRTPDTVRSIDDCTTAFKPRCLVQSSSENDTGCLGGLVTNLRFQEEGNRMPRRSILSAAERESLLALPDTKDELIRHYTFSESDLSIIRQRRGPVVFRRRLH
ncbi:DUF4158 domain-containing protein, partial [Klebsiella pneumoniae]